MAGMTPPLPSIDGLYDLPETSLRALASSIRGGPLSVDLSLFALQPIAGGSSASVFAILTALLHQGMGLPQIALLLEALAGLHQRLYESRPIYDIVLSGPDVPSVPTADTGAVMQTLIAEASRSIMLIGYAVHNGKRLFAPLAERMRTNPELQVALCIDISRSQNDTSLSEEIVARFVGDFRAKHWPSPQVPTILYDPRALVDDRGVRASLHAKCVIVDRRAALITSANFTEAAHQRNIEAGVLVRDESLVGRLAAYFDGLRASRQLLECPRSG